MRRVSVVVRLIKACYFHFSPMYRRYHVELSNMNISCWIVWHSTDDMCNAITLDESFHLKFTEDKQSTKKDIFQ